MNLLLHIFKTDVRRVAPSLLAWTVLTIAATVLEGYAPRAEAAGTLPAPGLLILVGAMLWLARMLTAVVLIVSIVQGHALAGTTAFWLTRPVPRATLFAAKLLLVALTVVLVPALCEWVLMASYAVPARDMVAVILEWAAIRVILASLVMVVAALTRTFSQFALAMAISNATIALLVLGGFAAAQTRTRPVAYVGLLSSEEALQIESHLGDQTGAVVAWLLIVAAASAALWIMFRARRRGMAAGVAMAGMILAVTVGVLWPWPLLHATPRVPAWAASDGLFLEAPSQQVWFLGPNFVSPGEGGWQTAVAQVFVRGLSPGWFATARLLDGELQYDGQTLRSGPSPGSTSLPSAAELPSSHRAAVQHALGLSLRGEPWRRSSATAPILFFPTTEAPLSRTRGSYQGRFAVSLYRVEVATSLSWQDVSDGAVFQDGPYRVAIRTVEMRERGPLVTAVVSNGRSIFHRHPQPQYSFYLRHRQTGEAVEGQISRGLSRLVLPGVFIFGQYGFTGGHTGFFAEATDVRFVSTHGAQLSSPPGPLGEMQWRDPEWLGSAELVILRTTLGGTVTRTVTIGNVAINGGATVVKVP